MNGIRLLEQFQKLKHGRKVYYKIARVNADLDLYTSICNNIFNTREYENFACYFCYRMMNTNEPITRKFLSEMSWASQKTIKMITYQFDTVNSTIIYDGINVTLSTFKL